jgi:transposase
MKPYSHDLREKIVAALLAGISRKQIVQIFKVSLSTIQRFHKQWRTEGSLLAKKASGRPLKIKPEHYEALASQIEAAPDVVLAEHCQTWHTTQQVLVSRATLCRTLARIRYSRKKKTLVATERDETKRENFRLKQANLELSKLVVLDETATNLGMTSRYAYSLIGKRAYGTAQRNHGKNITMLAAFTLTGMAAETAIVLEGSVDSKIFDLFIRDYLCPTLLPGQIVILDNLAAHGSESVRSAIEAKGCELLFLPPYSPDFSPIELAFSKIKEYLRQKATRSRAGLEEALTQALALITPQDAANYFRHCGYPSTSQ